MNVGEEEWEVVCRDTFDSPDVSYGFPIHSVGRMEAHIHVYVGEEEWEVVYRDAFDSPHVF